MEFIIELVIGGFAGYCCIYFLGMKLFKKEPTELIVWILTELKEGLENNKRR